MELAHGQRPDVSALLHFRWWQPVYYHHPSKSFPSKSQERLGRWVGVAPNQGDALTYRILDNETHKVVPRSVIRSAEQEQDFNLRSHTPDDDGESSWDGETKPVTGKIKSVTDFLPPQYQSSVVELPSFHQPNSLAKHTYTPLILSLIHI